MCDRFPMEVGKGPNKIKVLVQCRTGHNLVRTIDCIQKKVRPKIGEYVKVCVGMTRKELLRADVGFGKTVKEFIKNETVCVPAKKIFLHPLLGTEEVCYGPQMDGLIKFNSRNTVQPLIQH